MLCKCLVEIYAGDALGMTIAGFDCTPEGGLNCTYLQDWLPQEGCDCTTNFPHSHVNPEFVQFPEFLQMRLEQHLVYGY